MSFMELVGDSGDVGGLFLPTGEERYLRSNLQCHCQFRMNPSEIIINRFYYHHFKTDYFCRSSHFLRQAFYIISYNCFIKLQSVLLQICVSHLHVHRFSTTARLFINYTPFHGWNHDLRNSHFTSQAKTQHTKNFVDWFYSFRRQLVIDSSRELLIITYLLTYLLTC
jgi:hypothetical protein